MFGSAMAYGEMVEFQAGSVCIDIIGFATVVIGESLGAQMLSILRITP